MAAAGEPADQAGIFFESSLAAMKAYFCLSTEKDEASSSPYRLEKTFTLKTEPHEKSIATRQGGIMKPVSYTKIYILSLLPLFFLWLSVGAAAEMADDQIVVAVENQILQDPGTTLNTIDVTATSGIVTLSGMVDNILAKERAVTVAQTVRGVRSVVDKISVNPPLRQDPEIASDIEQALIYDPLSESWNISASVENGHVTLTGAVDSWAAREAVGKIAKGVRGVISLENSLAITYNIDRKDVEMEEEIERRLHWDALVDNSLIEVEVKNDQAFLTGTVGSAAERVQAHRDSWVAGITAVNSTGLEVDWQTRDPEQRKKKNLVRDDAEIQRAVEDAFLYDPRINRFEITVMVKDGWVTLKGTVDNLLAKRSAARDARNSVGVWHVKNLIKVRPSGPGDRLIADSVRNAFFMDPYVEGFAIDVSVDGGEVYLSGTVDTYYQKAQADYIAAGVAGVSKVRNRLQVTESKIMTYSPYVDPWYTYDYDWYIYPDYIPVKTDVTIRAEIEEEIFWSPFVDGGDITVTVDDGIATLTGNVDSYFEYNSAVENALEGGAVGVDNELVVNGE